MPDTTTARAPLARKVTLLGLIGATYFMVAGGPFALEDVIQQAGYFWAVVVLLVIPFIWSLPTALMVSELSSAIPEEGGYYVWVRRALGPFWGFQEAWLSLTASVFDMAIYPILFTTYLGKVGQALGGGRLWDTLAATEVGKGGAVGLLVGISLIAACALANLRTPRSVGRSSLFLTVALLGPFVVVSVLAFRAPASLGEGRLPAEMDYVGALLFAMWNYMGWDNATTIAADVERPQYTYPRAMLGAVALVTLTYIIPVCAIAQTGLNADEWTTGTWVTVAKGLGGTALAVAVGVGGMIMGFGMFNSLVLSYTRLPVVLAEDGFLPSVFTRRLRSGAPWVAVLVCAIGWGLALQLPLKHVLALDVILYGMSLLLEFAALVALRIREPGLRRPFRVPGGTVGSVLLGVFPALIIGLAIFDRAGKWEPESPDDPLAPAWALILGVGLAALGPLFYFLARKRRTPAVSGTPPSPPRS